MPKKKSIDDLIQTLEKEAHALEHMEDSLETTLKRYEKTISLSQELLSRIDQQQKAFELLKDKSTQLGL